MLGLSLWTLDIGIAFLISVWFILLIAEIHICVDFFLGSIVNLNAGHIPVLESFWSTGGGALAPFPRDPTEIS